MEQIFPCLFIRVSQNCISLASTKLLQLFTFFGDHCAIDLISDMSKLVTHIYQLQQNSVMSRNIHNFPLCAAPYF